MVQGLGGFSRTKIKGGKNITRDKNYGGVESELRWCFAEMMATEIFVTPKSNP